MNKKPSKAPKGAAKAKPREQTLEEVKYLKSLIENGTPVRVRLTSNEEYSGTVEFYDQRFIRLTRDDGPNLFIFKHDIKYIAQEQ